MHTKHKNALLAEKVRLESALGNIGQRNPRVPGDWEPSPSEADMESDLADRADAVVNRENNAAVFADLEARYDSVLSALSRIEKRTYGICEVCGNKIEEQRMVADSTATTCIAHL